MSLTNLQLPPVIDTSTGDLIADFFAPVLAEAVKYDRGVGYFSSGWLCINARGMVQFAANGGRARWVTSPILDEADWESLYTGDAARTDPDLRAILERNVTDLAETLEQDTLSALAWMVADEILDFKIALPCNKLEGGDFHDKFGVFTDAEGNQVSFNGSYNESIQGTRNYESIKIFCSWQPAYAPLVRSDADRFERLWSNLDPNVRVFDLPEAAREQILRLRTSERPYPEPEWVKSRRVREIRAAYRSVEPFIPNSIDLRDYQIRAIEAWEKNNHCGILDMATGTGKTVVALTAIVRCVGVGFIVIGAPTTSLVNQWLKELEKIRGIRSPVEISGSNPKWSEELLPRLRLAVTGETQDQPFVFVGTYKSLSSDRFRSILDRVPPLDNLGLLVADEVHNLGAPTYQRLFLPHFSHRLGLTATLERAYDEEGTQTVSDYFGGVVYELGIDKAIGPILCRYRYDIYFIELDEGEFAEYQRLSVRIASLMNKSPNGDTGKVTSDQSSELTRLLNGRARIIRLAQSKLDLMRELITQVSINKCLIYCADIEQVRAVQGILTDAGISNLHYTSEESPFAKSTALNQLRRDDIQAIVAVKCLDEGIDVPQVHRAILLASSTSEREFVQRRGRILRKAEGKRYAHLIDVFTVPPRRYHENPPTLLFNELKRARILARAADNRFEAENKLIQELSLFGIPIEQALGVEDGKRSN